MAAPQIQFENETLNFGKVTGGQPINAVFAFKNVGDAELEITSVRPGCGCTKALARSKKLAPGESSEIEAVFNSAGFSGTTHKGITVSTNDPNRATLQLSIRGEVVPVAAIQPATINFGSVKANTTVPQTLKIVPSDPKTFAITKVEVHGTHITTPTFKKVETPTGTAWEVSFNIRSGDQPGRVIETLNVVSNAGILAKLSATVYGNVVE